MATMRNYLCLLFAFIVTGLFSCQRIDEDSSAEFSPETRVYGDNQLNMIISVNTDDVHPGNAGDYLLPDGKPFADVVEFYAAFIGKRMGNGTVEPTLFLNEKMTNLLENGGYEKYVQPLQAKGIKVLLTIVGDHKGIGLSSMNAGQTTQFAKILAHAVDKYGLDGIGFVDQYADDEGYYRAESYSEIITKLHDLLPPEKLISIKDWGQTFSLSADAVACIDYGYHGFYGPSNFVTSRSFDIAKSSWSPVTINLGHYNNGFYTSIYNSVKKISSLDYYGMMFFNLRTRTENDPTNVFIVAAVGTGYEHPVTCENGNREQDWTSVKGGYTLTMDEIPRI